MLEPTMKTFVEGTTTGASILAITLTALTIILLFSYAIEVYLKLTITHLTTPFATVVLLSSFAPLISYKLKKRLVQPFATRFLTINLFYAILIVFVVIILVASCYFNAYLIEKAPHLSLAKCDQCGAYFTHAPWQVRFAVIYWGWWLLWTPLAGSYLAKISLGRTIRELILGLFLFPLLLLIMYFLWDAKPYLLIIYLALKLPVPLFLALLALVSWGIFSKMLKGVVNSSLFQSGYMPVAAEILRNRVSLKTASKEVGLSKFAPRLFMTLVGTVFLHTVAGWYGIQIQIAAMAVLVINAVYMGLDFLLARFFKDRAFLGNKNISPF